MQTERVSIRNRITRTANLPVGSKILSNKNGVVTWYYIEDGIVIVECCDCEDFEAQVDVVSIEFWPFEIQKLAEETEYLG